MAIEVRIPTILRTYTDGAKSVEVAVAGAGGTLSALIDDLEGNHPGIKGRLVEDKDGSVDLRRFVNVYVNDEEPVVVYHSHTATEAYPSRTDIGLASEPNAHYVLVSTREHGNSDGPVEFRSYRIIDGAVTEEDVTITPAAPPTEESTP